MANLELQNVDLGKLFEPGLPRLDLHRWQLADRFVQSTA